jgi:Na+/H+-dicarboxylate symporter
MISGWQSGGALTVVGALFVIIFILRKKGADFTLVILGALVAGFVVGAVFQGHTDFIAPLGKVYVSVLSALVIPLIIVSIVSSVTSLTSIAQLKGIGARSVFWLLTTTALSIVLTLGIALTLGIGRGSGISIQGVDASNYKAAPVGFAEILIGMVPRNIIGDISNERIVPVILFSVLVAVSYVLVAHEHGDKVLPFKHSVEAFKAVIFKAVAFVIELTPYAVLALMASVASSNLGRGGMMWSLLALLVVSFLVMAVDVWGVNAVLLKAFAGVNPWRFFRKIVPAQMVGFSTQSSAGTLPLTTSILTEKIGVAPTVATFTASLGTTIGMPGCSGIWPMLVAVYGIHGLGLNYGVRDYAVLALVSLIVSLGTAGVPGTSTVVTAAVLTAVGLPLQVLVLVIPISAIADTARTATNITAAMVASTIVARKEGLLDDAIFNDERDYEPALAPAASRPADATSPADVPRLVPVPQPSDLTQPLEPVGDAAYAALAAEMVGESCPF